MPALMFTPSQTLLQSQKYSLSVSEPCIFHQHHRYDAFVVAYANNVHLQFKTFDFI